MREVYSFIASYVSKYEITFTFAGLWAQAVRSASPSDSWVSSSYMGMHVFVRYKWNTFIHTHLLYLAARRLDQHETQYKLLFVYLVIS